MTVDFWSAVDARDEEISNVVNYVRSIAKKQ
jgi:hypothetical protein